MVMACVLVASGLTVNAGIFGSIGISAVLCCQDQSSHPCVVVCGCTMFAKKEGYCGRFQC